MPSHNGKTQKNADLPVDMLPDTDSSDDDQFTIVDYVTKKKEVDPADIAGKHNTRQKPSSSVSTIPRNLPDMSFLSQFILPIESLMETNEEWDPTRPESITYNNINQI